MNKYRPETPNQIYNLALLGYTDEQIREELEVDPPVFELWMYTVDAVKDALRRGRSIADGAVAASLYQRAVGFTHGKKYFPPDVKAAEIWLSRKQPEKWAPKPALADPSGTSYAEVMRHLFGTYEPPKQIGPPDNG